MAENENGAAPAATPEQPQAAAQPKMKVLGQYIRDMSFENVLAQKGIQGEVKPELKVGVKLDARKRGEGQFEVVMKLNVTSQNGGDAEAVLFLLEMEYAGLFAIEGLPDEQLHAYLLIECPRQIFPFARRIVSDVTRDGGFPSVNLEQIDFMALYRQEIARRQAAQAEATQAPTQ